MFRKIVNPSTLILIEYNYISHNLIIKCISYGILQCNSETQVEILQLLDIQSRPMKLVK